MEKKYKGSKFSLFIKKNIYLILMVVCLLAIIGMVAYTLATAKNNDNDSSLNANTDNQGNSQTDLDNKNNDDQQGNQPKPDESKETLKEIGLPVANPDVIKDYTDSELVFNATMKHWATHQGIDYKLDVGQKVMSVYDGTVTDITTNNLKGTTITIKHSDGFCSYYSLVDNLQVKVGDTVTKGQVIAEVAGKGVFESADGAHLHFELTKDGTLVDPNNYFASTEK